MFWITLYVIILSAAVQSAFQYPRQCLRVLLPLIRRLNPKWARAIEFYIGGTTSPSETVFGLTPSTLLNRKPKSITPISSSMTPPRSISSNEPTTPPRSISSNEPTTPPRSISSNEPTTLPVHPRLLGSFPPDFSLSSNGTGFDSILEDYEQRHRAKVIFINHKETHGMFGSSHESLGDKDAKSFVDIMRNIPRDMNIHLFLNTNGGAVTAAEIISHALVRHRGKITIYIPYTCMSAGTIIALFGDEIYMDPNAHCGPIDPQRWGISVTSVVNFCRRYADSNTWVGDLAKLALGQAEAAMNRIREVLSRNTSWNDFTLQKIEEELLSGKHNHDKALFPEDMNEIVPIKSGLPNEARDLFQLFLHKDAPEPKGALQQMLGL